MKKIFSRGLALTLAAIMLISAMLTGMTVTVSAAAATADEVNALRTAIDKAKIVHGGCATYTFQGDLAHYDDDLEALINEYEGYVTRYDNGEQFESAHIGHWTELLVNFYTNNFKGKISYDYKQNGGSAPSSTNTEEYYRFDADLNITADVSGRTAIPADGYEFTGWSVYEYAIAGTTSTITVSAGTKLYAQYRKPAQDATFHYYNSSSTLISSTVNGYLYNKDAEATYSFMIGLTGPNPKNNPIVNEKIYSFLGWRTDESAAPEIYNDQTNKFKCAEGPIFYAVYMGTPESNATISFETGGGTAVASIPAYDYISASGDRDTSLFVLSEEPTKEASDDFLGWATEQDSSTVVYKTGDTVNSSTSMTLYAVWDCEHTGGTATCTTLAVCEKCHKKYGSTNTENHTFTGGNVLCDACGDVSADAITVYFTDNKEWGSAWIHYGSMESYTSKQMNLIGQDADGYDVYSVIIIPTGVEIVNFSEANIENPNLYAVAMDISTLANNVGYYCGEGGEGIYDGVRMGEWLLETYTFTSLDVSTTGGAGGDSGNEITIYFTNNKKWDGVWVMTVGGDGQPVIAPMALVGTDADGLEVYSYTVDPATLNGLNFVNNNELNGVTKSVMITNPAMVGDKVGFYAGVSMGSEGATEMFFPLTYTFTDLTASTTAQVGDTTVYFADALDWGSVILCLVTDSGFLPCEMKAMGTYEGGKTIYKGVFDSEDAVSIVFFNDIRGTKCSVIIEDFSNGAGYYCTTVDSNGAYNVETFEYKSAFKDVNIALGEDITVKYYTSGDFTAPQMRFTINGYTKTVDGVLESTQYKFEFDGVAPQWIGDTITAELIVGGVVVEIKEYSVLEYLNALKSKTAAELSMSEAKYSAMQTLIADLLIYGGAAQTYTGHNTGALVSEGITGTQFSEILSTDAQKRDGEHASFVGATVYFDSANAIMIKIRAQSMSGVELKLSVGGVEERVSYTDNGDGTYTVKTDAIKAFGFDDIYTLEVYKDGELDAVMSYSVKSYVRAKQGASGNMAELAKATYNYGLAAKAYMSAQ